MPLPLGTILEHPCAECGGKMELKNSVYGLFYGCQSWPACNGTHGAHKESGDPLGRPANKKTKEARIHVHTEFDRLWRGHGTFSPRMKRKDAYRWMQSAMGLSEAEAHIGNFDIEQCAKLTELVRAELARL